jgi:hypothetical protein
MPDRRGEPPIPTLEDAIVAYYAAYAREQDALAGWRNSYTAGNRAAIIWAVFSFLAFVAGVVAGTWFAVTH